MTLTRRSLIQAAGASAIPTLLTTRALAAAELKISHQFPGGTLTGCAGASRPRSTSAPAAR